MRKFVGDEKYLKDAEPLLTLKEDVRLISFLMSTKQRRTINKQKKKRQQTRIGNLVNVETLKCHFVSFGGHSGQQFLNNLK